MDSDDQQKPDISLDTAQLPLQAWNLAEEIIAVRGDLPIFVGETRKRKACEIEGGEHDDVLSEEEGRVDDLTSSCVVIPTKRFKVCSAVLVQAGGYWANILANDFVERQQKRIWLKEDDFSAIKILLDMLHLNHESFPSTLDPEELANLASTSDKYLSSAKVADIVKGKWLHNSFETLSKLDEIPRDCRFDKLLIAAWYFKHAQGFRLAACFLIDTLCYSDGELCFEFPNEAPSGHIHIDDRIPGKVMGESRARIVGKALKASSKLTKRLDAIQEVRKERFHKAGEVINHYLESHTLGQHRCYPCMMGKTCRNCSDVELCDEHEKVTRDCSATIYGRLLQSLETKNILRRRVFKPTESMSLNGFKLSVGSALNGIVPKDDKKHLRCFTDPLQKLFDEIKNLMKRSSYTFPEDIQRHFDRP